MGKLGDMIRGLPYEKRLWNFLHDLDVMLLNLDIEADLEDSLNLETVKQTVISFLLMKNIEQSDWKVAYLENQKRFFYEALENLKTKHKDIGTYSIVLFAEDYIFS